MQRPVKRLPPDLCVERKAPDLGMLGSLLDADGDGDIKDDVAKMGGSLLKSFLGKRR